MKKIIAGFLLLAVAFSAQTRIMRSWSYQELNDNANLIVIAKPLSTQDTTEQTKLPNISPDIHVTGLSSEFAISTVLKGDPSLKKLVLHHYRLTKPNQPMLNGPSLAAFDPKANTSYLLFLHLESDGRYSPVSGQTDPAIISILKLDGIAQ